MRSRAIRLLAFQPSWANVVSNRSLFRVRGLESSPDSIS